MDELYAKFLPQFIPVARGRVLAALAAASRHRDRAAITTVARELHTLAGEAGLLGLGQVVTLSRDCERKAKLLEASHADPDAEVLVAALRELERVVDGIAATVEPSAE